MSLINDALKRATKAQPGPGQPAETNAPMRPADTQLSHQSVGLPRYFFPVLLCVFGGAAWFILSGWEARRHSGFYPEPITLQARELSPERAANAASASMAPPVDTSGVQPESVSYPTPEGRIFSLEGIGVSATPEVPGGGGAPGEPAFRLQGIFYRPSRPSAVVNAKTVYVGDLISGARVKAIDQQGVTLERNGQIHVLTLP